MTQEQIEAAAIGGTPDLTYSDLVSTRVRRGHATLTYLHAWPDGSAVATTATDARVWYAITRIVNAYALTLVEGGLDVEVYASGGWQIDAFPRGHMVTW